MGNRAQACYGFEVLPIPVTARPTLDGHDPAVNPFGRAVGYPMPAKCQDVVQMPGEHLSDLAHRRQV